MSDYDPNYIQKKAYFLVGQKAVVLNDSGKILLLQRSEKAGAGGKWNLPGGGLEQDENPYDSIKREIKEETEIEVSEIKPFALHEFKNDDNTIIIGYISNLTSSSVKINWEHDDFKWVSKEEALGMDLTEVTRFFIKQYE